MALPKSMFSKPAGSLNKLLTEEVINPQVLLDLFKKAQAEGWDNNRLAIEIQKAGANPTAVTTQPTQSATVPTKPATDPSGKTNQVTLPPHGKTQLVMGEQPGGSAAPTKVTIKTKPGSSTPEVVMGEGSYDLMAALNIKQLPVVNPEVLGDVTGHIPPCHCDGVCKCSDKTDHVDDCTCEECQPRDETSKSSDTAEAPEAPEAVLFEPAPEVDMLPAMPRVSVTNYNISIALPPANDIQAASAKLASMERNQVQLVDEQPVPVRVVQEKRIIPDVEGVLTGFDMSAISGMPTAFARA